MDAEKKAITTSDDVPKRAYWFSHIKDWESSNVKQEAYCKQFGISYNTFTYWRGIFLAESRAEQNQVKFVPVKLSTIATQLELPRAIQIKLVSGHHVYLPITMIIDDIASLLRQLGVSHA